MMPSPLPNVFAKSRLTAALLEMEGYESRAFFGAAFI